MSSICVGVGVRYHVLIRREWPRPRFETIGKPSRSYIAAIRRLAAEFAADHSYVRGIVLMTAEYYDPVQVCEIRR